MLCTMCFAYALVGLLTFIFIVNCFVKEKNENSETVIVPNVRNYHPDDEDDEEPQQPQPRSPLRRSQRLIDQAAARDSSF